MSTTILSPQKIANFEIKELIGSGGMANIYKATQLSLERTVALKVLHRHLTLNENFVARFEKEAKRAAMLHHENIVSIIDYGRQDTEYFIAMEYIEGQNLKQMMTRLKRLPLELALFIGREIASGLKYAHSNGLIHRDIKPANIMLSSDGRVMITDFGIAKDHQDLSITDTGQMVGSPAYMSPEQAAGRPIDHRCDLFSLGITLYEIITGEKPFKGDNYQQLVTNIISAAPIRPGELRIDITPSIEHILDKLLTKDIESRYQDADILATDLENEINQYVVPPSKKLMCEFLINPIKTTEKLRTDRISKHTEKALYFMNLGHGRLADATKEFENVLRFDMNNKMAKSYLERLRSGKLSIDTAPPIKKSNRPFYMAGGISVLFLAFAFVIIYLSGINPFAGIKPKGADSNPQIQNQTPAEQIPITSMPENPPSKNTQINRPVVKAKPKNAMPTKSTAAVPKSQSISNANYPNQDLAAFGSLEIISSPQATFYVDQQEYGFTCGAAAKLPLGRHTVSIQAPGYRPVEKRIYTDSQKTTKLEIILQPN